MCCCALLIKLQSLSGHDPVAAHRIYPQGFSSHFSQWFYFLSKALVKSQSDQSEDVKDPDRLWFTATQFLRAWDFQSKVCSWNSPAAFSESLPRHSHSLMRRTCRKAMKMTDIYAALLCCRAAGKRLRAPSAKRWIKSWVTTAAI